MSALALKICHKPI